MIKITVPATSANLGGGFDCMGVAVNIYNEIYVRQSDGLVIDTDKDIPKDERNLVYRSMVALFDWALERVGGGNMPKILSEYAATKILNVYIKQVNNIPKTSGLGSSAACIVGGAAAANALLGEMFTKNEIADFCAATEGHPDNALPAIFGGAVASVMTDSGVKFVKTNVDKSIRLNIYTPSFPLETKMSRKVLPKSYQLQDVVYSLSRAVVTFAALMEGDIKLLGSVVGDRLHEPYRGKLIADFDHVVKASGECGSVAEYLSGAGPSIAAFSDAKFKTEKMRERLSYLPNNWRMFECEIANKGCTTENI